MRRNGRVRVRPVATPCAASRSASMPVDERAAPATTGTPISRSSRAGATAMPWRRASSIRLMLPGNWNPVKRVQPVVRKFNGF